MSSRLSSVALGTFVFLLSFSAMCKPRSKDPELLKREEMLVMSQQLGVTCIYCHNESNFKDDSLPAYKIALQHISITKLLNDQGFKGNPKVDCYLCHRGTPKPKFKDPNLK